MTQIKKNKFPRRSLGLLGNFKIGENMGIVNVVKNIKEVQKEYVVLIRVGNFYNCYGRDSYILSYLFGYKISIVEDDTYMCAFPKSAYNKVISKLENNKINYLVLDKRNNYEVEEKSNNNNLNKYQEIYEKSKKEISAKMRIEKIYKYLMENQKNEPMIFEIEKVINERRKIQSN